MRSKIFLFILMLGTTVSLAANPFTGGGTVSTPQPVLTQSSDPALVARQGDLRAALADYLYAWQNDASGSILWAILAVSFLYGVLHALGPGHRKTVVFSLYLARQAPAWEPLASSLALALLHGGAALILMLILRGISGAISGLASSIAVYMEGFAYLLLIILALFLVYQSIRHISGGVHRQERVSGLGTLLITGLYPCPGAILVLILSLRLQIPAAGALSVLAMSLGMSVPIIAAAYLAWFGRTGLFAALKKRGLLIERVTGSIELGGYLVLLIFSLYMAWPFLVGQIMGHLEKLNVFFEVPQQILTGFAVFIC